MKKVLLLLLCVVCVGAIFLPLTACAQSNISITAKEGILIAEDGQVLFEHNSTEKRPIASMTKIMTLLCIYDAVNQGKISLEDNVTVSKRASSMGGSQVYLDANCTYKAKDLVKSIIVCSANDSCVAMAEHICGSVEAFVKQMNNKSRQIGLVATQFENCTGLPAANQYSCAKDVAQMMLRLIGYPHYFECANVWMEDFVHPSGRVTGMTNTNKLVKFYQGCDGGKTGYTCEAQHCLCATAKRGDTRVVACVVGAEDSKTRFKEVSDMFNYAFANFESKVFAEVGDVQKISVEGGRQSQVSVAPVEKLTYFGEKGQNNLQVVWDLPQKISAPLQLGQTVGQIKLIDGAGTVVKSVDAVTCEPVQCKTYWDYLHQIINCK